MWRTAQCHVQCHVVFWHSNDQCFRILSIRLVFIIIMFLLFSQIPHSFVYVRIAISVLRAKRIFVWSTAQCHVVFRHRNPFIFSKDLLGFSLLADLVFRILRIRPVFIIIMALLFSEIDGTSSGPSTGCHGGIIWTC